MENRRRGRAPGSGRPSSRFNPITVSHNVHKVYKHSKLKTRYESVFNLYSVNPRFEKTLGKMVATWKHTTFKSFKLVAFWIQALRWELNFLCHLVMFSALLKMAFCFSLKGSRLWREWSTQSCPWSWCKWSGWCRVWAYIYQTLTP